MLTRHLFSSAHVRHPGRAGLVGLRTLARGRKIRSAARLEELQAHAPWLRLRRRAVRRARRSAEQRALRDQPGPGRRRLAARYGARTRPGRRARSARRWPSTRSFNCVFSCMLLGVMAWFQRGNDALHRNSVGLVAALLLGWLLPQQVLHSASAATAASCRTRCPTRWTCSASCSEPASRSIKPCCASARRWSSSIPSWPPNSPPS